MHRYYILAKRTKRLPHTNGFPWPYEIALCFDAVQRPVALSEGVGHGAAGGAFSVAEALQPKWHEHFSNARGEWLIPYLERLGEGASLDRNALLATSKAQLGHDPESYEVPPAIAERP